jgi:hypothetical protein
LLIRVSCCTTLRTSRNPIKYSNTALLYKKGWTGINIDLNKTSIDLFNFTRLRDKNILVWCKILAQNQQQKLQTKE